MQQRQRQNETHHERHDTRERQETERDAIYWKDTQRHADRGNMTGVGTIALWVG